MEHEQRFNKKKIRRPSTTVMHQHEQQICFKLGTSELRLNYCIVVQTNFISACLAGTCTFPCLHSSLKMFLRYTVECSHIMQTKLIENLKVVVTPSWAVASSDIKSLSLSVDWNSFPIWLPQTNVKQYSGEQIETHCAHGATIGIT